MCMYVTGPVVKLLRQLGMIVVGLVGNGGILCGALPNVAATLGKEPMSLQGSKQATMLLGDIGGP